jgi:serine/threonine protein kinase
MSVLYLARDADGRRVVLKMVPPEIATNATRTRLMREARALAVVDHPGVVRIHGTGEYDGVPWIAMDYVNGVDLKRVIVDRGALPPEVALRHAIQAAEALVAAHDAGVVHRDLKPSNLLLTSDGRIVLVDFGIAKRRADPREGDVLTSEREVLGTPAYLSPEQLEHGLADERSDIWALGCVLFEMVVGTPPFGRGGSTTTAAILRDEPTFPAYVSEAIAHIVSACLRKSSFARIASPRELLPLLRDALDDSRSRSPAERISSSVPRAPSRPSLSASFPTSASTRTSSPPRTTAASSRPPAPPWRATTIPPPRPAGPLRTTTVPPLRSTVPPRPGSIPSPSVGERAPSRPPSVAPAPPQAFAVASPRATPPPPRSSSSIRVAAQPGRIKGTAVRAGLAWYAETYGDAALAQVFELASPELQAILRLEDPVFGVMAASWYDTPLIGELLGTLEHVAAPGDPEVYCFRLAQAIARDNVGGVYRALFRLIASPKLLEANAQRVWRTYCDEGTLTVRIRSPGRFEGNVRDWTRHHPAVCRVLRALVEQVLRSIGYTGLLVDRTRCVGHGDPHCTWEGNWVV